MRELAFTPVIFDNMVAYSHGVNETGYYQLVSLILKAANAVVRNITVEKQNVLVHCSDGWDRTPQMCALSQILMHPHYRTVRGFCELVDKDWVQFGHKFHERNGAYVSKRTSQESPIFIQFLDCCH